MVQEYYRYQQGLLGRRREFPLYHEVPLRGRASPKAGQGPKLPGERSQPDGSEQQVLPYVQS